MDSVEPNNDNHPKIEVYQANGEWFVRVVENGKEDVISFDLESFALTYANGQRMRLGLKKITIMLPENSRGPTPP